MPTSEEVVLHGGDLEVVLLPAAGGRLHRLRAWGVDLLRTPADPSLHLADPVFWGAYPMAPWCNRIRQRSADVLGRTVALAPNFADGSAIHGQVFAVPWEVDGPGRLRRRGGGDGWPWRYDVALDAEVDGATLRLRYVLRNLDDGPMPAGLGLHPWFRRPVEVRVPARRAFRTNDGSSADPEPASRDLDLGRLGVPADDLDGTWVDLTAAPTRLRWPDAGIRAELRTDTSGPDGVAVAVATPADRDAIAVEPQTHGPDGLRRLLTGEPWALAVLPPGERLTLAVTLRVERSTAVR